AREWGLRRSNWPEPATCCASLLGRGGPFRHMLQREGTNDRGAAPRRGIQTDRTTVQLDERAYDRQAQSGAAMPRAQRVALEAIEHAILDFGGNAGAAVGDPEQHGVATP